MSGKVLGFLTRNRWAEVEADHSPIIVPSRISEVSETDQWDVPGRETLKIPTVQRVPANPVEGTVNDLSSTELLAFLRAAKEGSLSDSMVEIHKDGRVYRDIDAILEQGLQAFGDALSQLGKADVETPETNEGKGLLGALYERGIGLYDRGMDMVEGSNHDSTESIGDERSGGLKDRARRAGAWVVHHVLRPALAVDGDVIRTMEFTIVTDDNVHHHFTARVKDVEASLEVRGLDLGWSMATVNPIPFVPTFMKFSAAAAVHQKSKKVLHEEGDVEKSAAIRNIRRKFLTITPPLPGVAPLSFLISQANYGRLKSVATVEDLVTLGS